MTTSSESGTTETGSQGWTQGRSAIEALARFPADGIGARVVFAVMAALAFTGVLDMVLQVIGWDAIFERSTAMLQESITASSVMTFILATIKGLLAMLESTEASLFVASVDVGALVEGLAELIDTAFRFFISMTGLIAAQISLLRIIELAAMPLLVGIGALFMVVQPGAATLFGRVGRLMLALGVIFYFVFPLLITLVAGAYETQRIEAEIASQESFGVLQEKASDLSLSSVTDEEGREQIQQTLSSGVSSTWQSFLGLVTGYLLMFIILPLASLGVSYLLLRQVLNSLGFEQATQKIDAGGKGVSDWVRSDQKTSNGTQQEASRHA